MKEEKLSLLQRCIKWREANIKKTLYKGKTVYPYIKFSGRYLYSFCRFDLEVPDSSDTELSDR